MHSSSGPSQKDLASSKTSVGASQKSLDNAKTRNSQNDLTINLPDAQPQPAIEEQKESPKPVRSKTPADSSKRFFNLRQNRGQGRQQTLRQSVDVKAEQKDESEQKMRDPSPVELEHLPQRKLQQLGSGKAEMGRKKGQIDQTSYGIVTRASNFQFSQKVYKPLKTCHSRHGTETVITMRKKASPLRQRSKNAGSSSKSRQSDHIVTQDQAILATSNDPLASPIPKKPGTAGHYKRYSQIDMKQFDKSLDKLGLIRSLHTSVSVYPPDVVQEVVEGEETPLIRRNAKNQTSTQSKNPVTQESVVVVEPIPKRKYAKPLFPVMDGSVNIETIQSYEDDINQRLMKSSSVPAGKTTEPPSVRSQSKYDRIRRTEIDRNNKVLLGNMLKLEKDLFSIKQKLKTTTTAQDMLGLKSVKQS